MKHLFFFLLAVSLTASPVQFHESRGFDSLKGGELSGTGLTGDGRVIMMPAMKQMTDLNESYIWDACSMGTIVFAAAGEKGKIYRINPGAGAPRLLTYFDEGTVYALAVFRGKLYAGLSPEGTVYEINPDTGDRTEKFKVEASYIWRMKGTDEFLYLATGMPGTVQRVDRNFFRKTLAENLDTHVESLLVDGPRILAGTYPEGYILEIQEDKRPYLLVDTGFQEVRDLALVNGTLMAACFNGTPESNNKNGKVKPARQVTEPPTIKGGLVTVNSRNVPEVIATFDDMAPLSISSHDGNFIVGTGHSGKLAQVDDNRVVTIAGEVDCGQITRFFSWNNALHFCTSNPGQIYRVATAYELTGTYTAVPLVQSSPVNWGRVYFDATTPAGSRVEFHVRSGNSASPDETWSAWKKVDNGGPTGLDPSTGFQWRATLISQDPAVTPSVQGMHLYFRSVNLAPRISEIQTLPAGVWIDKEAEAVQTAVIPARAKATVASMTPPKDLKVAYMPGIQSVHVVAADPNGDTLLYDFQILDERDREITRVKDSMDPAISIHTEQLPEGTYRFKVSVTDRLDNAPDELSDVRTGFSFVVDRTPPAISMGARQGGSVQATVSDERSVVEAVAISTDGGKKWLPLWPEDGVPDSGRETYRIPVGSGETVIVRVTDDHGNTRTAIAEGR